MSWSSATVRETADVQIGQTKMGADVMEGPRPIDVYRDHISNLQELREEFLELAKRLPLRHQLFLWQGPGEPSNTAWEQFLLEEGILPDKATVPGEKASFEFSTSTCCQGFRWQGQDEIPVLEAIFQNMPARLQPLQGSGIMPHFDNMALRAIVGLQGMHEVHEWCLPGAKSMVPTLFLAPIVPASSSMAQRWLESVYAAASEWPAISDAPAWMPTTRDLVGKKAKAKLVESQEVWMLSAEAISRWLPPDVDDFMSSWKAIASALPSQKPQPHWDAAKSELTYNGKVVKRFKQPAKNQTTVLAAFEQAGWPDRIPDPLSTKGFPNPKRLGYTVVQLKKNHITKPNLIHFEMDGNNAGVIWHP